MAEMCNVFRLELEIKDFPSNGSHFRNTVLRYHGKSFGNDHHTYLAFAFLLAKVIALYTRKSCKDGSSRWACEANRYLHYPSSPTTW